MLEFLLRAEPTELDILDVWYERKRSGKDDTKDLFFGFVNNDYEISIF